MNPKSNIQEIDKVVLNELIARVEHAIEHDLALSVDDMKLLLSAIMTLLTLQEKMEQDDITLHKLHKLLGIVKQQVANAVMPLYYEFQRLGANAHQFLLDDTRNRILTQQPELKEKRNGKGQQLRTGVYSSGLIAQLADNHEVVLFQTSLGHAGEHLDSILTKRDPALPPPRTMSDALSSNSTVASIIQAYCNAHCRRLFYDLASLYPTEVEWVLETYALIWKNENKIRQEQLNEAQRLAYHKEHSLPVMESLKAWALKQQSASEFEEHSTMGKAIKYLLRHYDKLILFCVVPGALIDNNRMEEKLKIVIRGRKTSHFYKTPVGAQVANVLISLIATADGEGINVFDYLMALQKNQEAIKHNPGKWLPWNYLEQLREKPPDENLKSQNAA